MILKNNNRGGNFRSRLLGPAAVHIALACFAGFLLVRVWDQFVSNPTVTTLENSTFSVAKIPFPGVAFCSVNKISKRRARNLAGFIANATGERPEEILEYIKFLGFLYDADYVSYTNKTKIESFQKILDKLQLKINGLMRDLTTPCEELLHSCRWKGKSVNCSSILNMRLTFDGYCCTFNYVKNTTDMWWRQDGTEDLTPQVGTSGIIFGLSVTIHNDRDDYFYTILATTGVKVHVFIPTDYPDKASGDLIETLADIGSENFLEIIPTTVRAVRDVMSHRVDKRNCLFKVEQQTQFGVYSQSDCFVDCRVKSMRTLCECIPFTIPFNSDANVCTLSDLPCLKKYQVKWRSLNPQNLDERFPLKEKEESVCPGVCYPSCEATLYELASSSVPLYDRGNHTRSRTYIHIYYGNRFHNLFVQDVVHYWFDVLSSVGGIFGVVLGFSLLSIVEGIIYCAKYVAARW